MTHFDTAAAKWQAVNDDVIDFGTEMMHAIDTENRTIREMSIKLCGNTALEDRIGRWVMAARWIRAIQYHPLYEDARQWLTPSHFTNYWKIYKAFDMEYALDVFEKTFVRNPHSTEIQEVHPYEWVRAHLGRSDQMSTEEVYHRFWMYATKALAEAYSEVERKGLTATPYDWFKLSLLKMAVRMFQAEPEQEKVTG